MRHTAAVNWLNNGMSLAMASRLLGHKNLATTMIYLNFVNSDIAIAHAKFSAADRWRL